MIKKKKEEPVKTVVTTPAEPMPTPPSSSGEVESLRRELNAANNRARQAESRARSAEADARRAMDDLRRRLDIALPGNVQKLLQDRDRAISDANAKIASLQQEIANLRGSTGSRIPPTPVVTRPPGDAHILPFPYPGDGKMQPVRGTGGQAIIQPWNPLRENLPTGYARIHV
jgi:hypothetical protein